MSFHGLTEVRGPDGAAEFMITSLQLNCVDPQAEMG